MSENKEKEVFDHVIIKVTNTTDKEQKKVNLIDFKESKEKSAIVRESLTNATYEDFLEDLREGEYSYPNAVKKIKVQADFLSKMEEDELSAFLLYNVNKMDDAKYNSPFGLKRYELQEQRDMVEHETIMSFTPSANIIFASIPAKSSVIIHLYKMFNTTEDLSDFMKTVNYSNSYSHPMVIKIENLSEIPQKFKLFGFGKYGKKKRYGNNKNIKISSLSQHSYDEYFTQMSEGCLLIKKFRFQSTEVKNLHEKFYHHQSFIFEGKTVKSELNLYNLHDAYQFQNDIIDVTKHWVLTKDTFLSGEIKGKSIFVISLYFDIEGLEIPRLSGKNVAPVIIVTESKIKDDTTKESTEPPIKEKKSKK